MMNLFSAPNTRAVKKDRPWIVNKIHGKFVVGAQYEEPPEPGDPRIPAGHTPVVLHLYDFTQYKQFGMLNSFLNFAKRGAYHTGVEVYGLEWSFGGGQPWPETGVFCIEPVSAKNHIYRTPILMGYVSMPPMAIQAIIDQMAPMYISADYDLFRKNCNTFCNEFCEKLGVGHIPSFVTKLTGNLAQADDLRFELSEAHGKTRRVCCGGDDSEDEYYGPYGPPY
mmetsp:Transcript_17474/g.31723  ORF Transcript_17474/g.31723 Transcript_17474/m.31723 type:complete len:223 (+) Transcript_17474:87-755(+)